VCVAHHPPACSSLGVSAELRPAPSTEKCSSMLSGDRGNHVALHMDSSESVVRGEQEPITGISRGSVAARYFYSMIMWTAVKLRRSVHRAEGGRA